MRWKTWLVDCKLPSLGDVVRYGWNYPDNFFPRKFRYKKDAYRLAKEIASNGAKEIIVKQVGRKENNGKS